ncbi:hypothetical protein B0H21DRAFT_820302 [Amylocystis lapponica]|nr:hypothetical protein B0H21DRAFT_820302 [Amylocystis lapponica]
MMPLARLGEELANVRYGEATRIIVHLVSGFSCWDLAIYLPLDWSIISGKRGCKWGYLFLYAPCQYLTLMAVLAALFNLNTHWFYDNSTVVNIFQITTAISMGLSLTIMTERVSSIWKNYYISSTLGVLHSIMWAVVVKSLSRFPEIWRDYDTFVAMYCTVAVISTLSLTLGVLGLVVKRKLDDTYEPGVLGLLRHLRRNGTFFLFAVWAAELLSGVMGIVLQDACPPLEFVTGFTGYIVVMMCASHTYRDMIRHSRRCPVTHFCVVYYAVRTAMAHMFGFGPVVYGVQVASSSTVCPYSGSNVKGKNRQETGHVEIALKDMAVAE